jgi:hypothetical protein
VAVRRLVQRRHARQLHGRRRTSGVSRTSVSHLQDAPSCRSGANPTIASYNSSAVKIYNSRAVKLYNSSAVGMLINVAGFNQGPHVLNKNESVIECTFNVGSSFIRHENKEK